MRFSSIIRDDCARICRRLGATLNAIAGDTLLITGANGFLCSYIVDVLAHWNETASSPCRIIAVDNMITGVPTRLAHLADRPDVVFVEHDVTQALPKELRANWLIHGASIASPTFYRKFPLETVDANVQGTRQILDSARHAAAKGVLLLSSSEIYGDPGIEQIPTPENYRGNVSSFGPRACYDESKRLAETLGYIYSVYHGVPIVIVRPFNVFGPGQRLDDQRIIPDVMAAAVNRRPIRLLSEGTATRSFCYISDFIFGLLALLVDDRSKGEVYNLGNDEIEISMHDLARRMCSVSESVYGEPVLTIEHAVSQDKNYTADNPQRRCPDLRKVRATIGYAPEVGLDEGLRRTLMSHLEVRA